MVRVNPPPPAVAPQKKIVQRNGFMADRTRAGDLRFGRIPDTVTLSSVSEAERREPGSGGKRNAVDVG
jgi:hypothetical protein